MTTIHKPSILSPSFPVPSTGISQWEQRLSFLSQACFFPVSLLKERALGEGIERPGQYNSSCTHKHTCTHQHTHMQTNTCTRMHTQTYKHTCAHKHTCTHKHMHTQTHMHKHMHAHAHTNTYKHTCIHTHTRAHTSTQARGRPSVLSLRSLFATGYE